MAHKRAGAGYSMFPLSDDGYTEAASDVLDATTKMFANFQDAMHMAVTVLVILLSIASLLFIIVGGYCKKNIFHLQYGQLSHWP